MPTKCLTAIDMLTFECPQDRGQAFLWDTEVKGLGVRTTPRGIKVFIFQGRQREKTVRKTIGRVDELSIAEARTWAMEYRLRIDSESELAFLPEQSATSEINVFGPDGRHRETIGKLWSQYVELGRPTGKRRGLRGGFSHSYMSDLRWMASPGGVPKKRGSGELRPGPLNPLMAFTVGELDEGRLSEWLQDQCSRSHTQATRALAMFRGFLRWCGAKPELKVPAAKALKAFKSLGPSARPPARKPLTSFISPEDLPAWWAAVLKLPNKKVGAYLRALVMTGLHSRAVLNLRWADIRVWWGANAYFTCHPPHNRNMPLAGGFVKLIESLPRDSEFVFSKADQPDRVLEPRYALQKTLREVGLASMPLSALRRTFLKLAEIAGVPSEAVVLYSFGYRHKLRRRYPSISHPRLRRHVSSVESTLTQILGVKSLA